MHGQKVNQSEPVTAAAHSGLVEWRKTGDGNIKEARSGGTMGECSLYDVDYLHILFRSRDGQQLLSKWVIALREV